MFCTGSGEQSEGALTARRDSLRTHTCNQGIQMRSFFDKWLRYGSKRRPDVSRNQYTYKYIHPYTH